MIPLFSLIDSQNNNIGSLSWYTWSPHYKKELLHHRHEISSIPIFLNYIASDQKYGYSYDISTESKISNTLELLVSDICNQLVRINTSCHAFLLSNLLFDEFDKDALKGLITLISHKFRAASMDSFHSPVKTYKIDTGFPVHADLFGPRALLNIMTNHEQGKGGDILLLKKYDLIKTLKEIKSIDKKIVRLIEQLLCNRYEIDGFDVCFQLLYGDNPWQDELKSKINRKTYLIENKNGIGYFLEDGEWLHGRTKINGEVCSDRFQRLVFDTYITRSKLTIDTEIIKSLHQNTSTHKAYYRKASSSMTAKSHIPISTGNHTYRNKV